MNTLLIKPGSAFSTALTKPSMIPIRRLIRWGRETGLLIGMVCCFHSALIAQSTSPSSDLVLARVRYRGGGDWYNDPSALPNLSHFLRREAGIDIAAEEARISLMDETLFAHPFLFLTGHGNIVFSDEETERLRTYLSKGGFLYVDDDYGLDPHFRSILKRVFPERPLVELPFSHGIYNIHFRFPNGLPKIHEHDNQPPRGFGVMDDAGRLMIFYTFETNLSDGWADPDVHGDPPDTRESALRMGSNIVLWALMH